MAINYFQQLGLDSFNPGQALAQGQAYRMNEFELNAAKQREQQLQQAQQQQALKFANDQQKQLAAQAAGMFYNSLQFGDKEGAKQIAARYQNEINSLGDPSFTVDRVNMMLETPEGLEQLKQASLGIVQLAAGPDDYATYTRGLAEASRVKPMTAYEQAQIELERNKSKQKPFEQGTGNASGFVFDPNTGRYTASQDILNNIVAERQRLDAEGKKLDAKTIVSLNKDISTITKEAEMIHNTAKDVSALGKLGTGPASIAIVYKFMKSLDPTSVVREGEFATAANAGGVPDNIMNAYNRLLKGDRLPPNVIADFERTAKELANTASDSATGAVDLYLATFEDQMPESLKKNLLGRVPKRFDIENKPENNTVTTPTNQAVPETQSNKPVVVDFNTLPSEGR